MRLRSRFMATTSGTVIFLGGTVVAPPYAVCSLMSTSVQAGFVPVPASPQSYRAGIPRTIHSSSRIAGRSRRRAPAATERMPPIAKAGAGPSAATIPAKTTGAIGRSRVPPKAAEHVAPEDRLGDAERTDLDEEHDRPGEDEDPEPRHGERVREALADLPQERRRRGRLVPRRPREGERGEADEERRGVGRKGERKARERDEGSAEHRPGQQGDLPGRPPKRVPGLENIWCDQLREQRGQRGVEERACRAEHGGLEVEVLHPQL